VQELAERLALLRREERARAALRRLARGSSVEAEELEPPGVPVLVVRPLPAASA